MTPIVLSGEDNPYSDVVHKQATSPVFTSTGTWYWGIKIIYGDAKTGWYCRDSRGEDVYPNWVPTEGTVGIGNWMWIWNHADNSNLTVEVLPIPDPDNFTANGTTLSWVKNEPGHDVVIVKTVDPAWVPTQGSSIPGANIVYAGDGTSCSSLENTSIYKIYSVNNNYYSSGITYIPDGYSLGLTKDVTLDGDLYLSSQSELTSVGSLLTANNIYLKVTVENSDGWNFIGLPFAVSTITDTEGRSLSGEDYAVARYDGETRAGGESGWTSIGSPASLPAGGYIFWVNEETVPDLTLIMKNSDNFITVINSGTIDADYPTNENTNDIHHGWNLVANPLFSTTTATMGAGVFYYGYDSTNGTYRVEDEKVDDAKPFTSYFIKAPAAETSIAVRSTPPSSARSGKAAEKLTVYLGEGNACRTKIRLRPEANAGYDILYDAPHLMPFSPSAPQIYTLIDADKMAINSLPGETDVDLGIRVPQAGEYTIRWDSQLSGKTAALYDKETNRTIDTAQNTSYIFNTDRKGEINDRFSIYFTPAVSTKTISAGSRGQVRVRAGQGAVLVEGLTGNSTISLYDLLGNRLHTAATDVQTYTVAVAGKGIYLIDIHENGLRTRNKVIVR
jgi:hypothetical protein